jgi:hypothetical protein
MSPPRLSPLRETPDGLLSSHRSESPHSSLSASSLYQPMMPPIAEHGTHHNNRYSQAYNQNIVWPQTRTPLRVPRKSPRKELARSQAIAAATRPVEGPPGEKDSSCIPPPPYGNGTTAPPGYGDDTQAAAVAAAGLAGKEGSSWRDRHWFGRRSTRWGLCGFLILMLLGLVVGLSVGLTVALNNGYAFPLLTPPTHRQFLLTRLLFPGAAIQKTTERPALLQRRRNPCSPRVPIPLRPPSNAS